MRVIINPLTQHQNLNTIIMKTKIILAAAAIVIISAGQTIAQSWNLTGNAGTSASTNFIGTTDNMALKIRTNNVVRMNINTSGKIALGNFTPVFKFDVKGGSINTDSLYRISGVPVLSRNAANNKVQIGDATVKVGIGTANPVSTLDVNGVIKSNELLVGTSSGATGYIVSIGGKMIAEEVRVDLEAIWPDYVFDENYKLMPIQELDYFVSNNKHLPGIPSADKIKESGIMLGEMQTKTLEKVEEAMLYIIQLDSENKLLKGQIQDLQKQIDDLKK